MKKSINNRKKFLALCLSALMVSSVASLAACKGTTAETSSSSSSSSTSNDVKDTGLIKNAGFETFNNDKGNNPIETSPTGWSNSRNSTSTGDALLSESKSGILDTSEDAWKDLTTNTLSTQEIDALVADKAAAADKFKSGTLTAKDKLDYYAAWKKKNSGKTISKELKDFYESFDIDNEDVPTCENPGVHEGSAEDDTNVLMIHNAYDTDTYKAQGTAQKYTSSSTVTVKAGTAAQFSVWVKTSDLECSLSSGGVQEAVDLGAYIRITHSVGGRSLDPLEVKNIQADEWTQYSFYLQATAYADTTFSIVLGLGQSGGQDRMEYVNGYAFFDDIQCEIINQESFAEQTSAIDSKYTYGFENTAEEKVINAYEDDTKAFALDFYGAFDEIPSGSSYIDTFKVDVTTEKATDGTQYTAATNNKGIAVYHGLGFDTSKDIVKVLPNAASMLNQNSTYLSNVYNDYFDPANFDEEEDFLKANGKNEKILMLMSAGKAAYTATSSYTFDLAADEYQVVSFFVKTSALNGFTGASIVLHDGNNTTAISSLDTTTISPVEIADDKDFYDGWQQCFFFVANETESGKTFTLSFHYGSTTVVGTTTANYYEGFAAFAGFESKELSEEEYSSATSGTYTKVVSLTGDTDNAAGDSGFDSPASVPSDAIEQGYADPKNYRGVYSDSAYVGVKGGSTEEYLLETAGLFNKEYADNYGDLYTKLGASNWEEAFGNETTQPLVIYNEKAADKSYGFVAKTSTTASDYKTVSLRIKTNTTAYVYLVDRSGDSLTDILSIGRKVSYWYDANGNVCAEDPAENSNQNNIAFKLQSNGLYQVNPNWEHASKVDKNAFFANLANYEKDDNGNLIVADGGVSYDYDSNDWNDEGQDGIAFYAKDGKYYADKACTIAVTDFAAVEGLEARYAEEAAKELSFKVGNTNGKWATVTFYLHVGDVAKNYRLEVWNGARGGENVGMAAGSYEIVDAYSPDAVDATSFENLINDKKDEVEESAYFENVFSFYDSAKYLRYNEKLDNNGVGNSYDDYDATAEVSGIAYLKYESETEYQIFADYGLSDKTATADVEEDDDHDHEEEHDHAHEETNWWLLGSSIALAAVLLIAVASLIIRNAVKKSNKKKAADAAVAAQKSKKEKKN